MEKQTIFDKVCDLTQKFSSLFKCKKKLKALENYSNVAPFYHDGYLKLIKKCMSDGFPGHKEADFLDYMLGKYEVNFLDWSHKTKWLKNEMSAWQAKNKKPTATQMMLFDLEKTGQTMSSSLPAGLLQKKRHSGECRV